MTPGTVARLLTGAPRRAGARGPLTAQIAGRPIGVMMGIGTALNPFSIRPSYREVDGLGIAEQRQRLAEPACVAGFWPRSRPLRR